MVADKTNAMKSAYIKIPMRTIMIIGEPLASHIYANSIEIIDFKWIRCLMRHSEICESWTNSTPIYHRHSLSCEFECGYIRSRYEDHSLAVSYTQEFFKHFTLTLLLFLIAVHVLFLRCSVSFSLLRPIDLYTYNTFDTRHNFSPLFSCFPCCSLFDEMPHLSRLLCAAACINTLVEQEKKHTP